MRALRIGFVATRLAGIDGVSLEAAKWADVLQEMGHDVYYFGGIVDRPPERSRSVPEAFFGHADIAAINDVVFGDAASRGRPPAVSRRIEEIAAYLREQLLAFVRDFAIDMLVPENALAIPLHLPLGLAITQVAADTGMPVLAHHHDLAWERQRFSVNAASDIIAAAFPPSLPTVRHVCINTDQREQIARRLGRAARVIPNVMDFGAPPPRDTSKPRLRADLGFAPGELLVLQPVRVVPRKGIEHAVELVARLERPARLVISHPAGDEGMAYEERIRDLARLLSADVVWVADRVGGAAEQPPNGPGPYTLAEMYGAADLVAYTSLIEGFGNAYLEAVYYRRPVFVNRYPIFDLDIRPLGFRNIEMNGFLTEEEVVATRQLLDDPGRVEEWTDHNYRLGLRHFSYEAVRRGLAAELDEMFPSVP